MKSLIAKTILLIGTYLYLLSAIVISNQSALYVEGDEIYYLLTAVVTVIVCIPMALVFKLAGAIQKEQPRKLFTKQSRAKIYLLFSSLLLIMAPTIYNRFQLFRYGITSTWQWSSGSENYNVLKIQGSEFCAINTKTKLTFEDANSDGYPDIVYGNKPGQVLYHQPDTGQFTGCPYLGG